LVSYISGIMTLAPGDVVMTGTPNIGPLQRGDTVEVDISGIGVLQNRVV
jgi:2-keto-4-pentenoate hydratase/2-oxohepta-3-ene-1,7-dioic acid hydratase in catechol pathway